MKTIKGKDVQSTAAIKLNVDFAALIALSSIWAPKEAHEACHDGHGSYASVPNCRRKRHNEPRGEVNGVIYNDNTRPNSKMKAMARMYYNVDLEEFTVCHVWPDTCYDVRYHTCFANLVLIPAAIHSLTDYDSHVEACLKYRAYELFRWKPDEEDIPKKPDNYPTEWLELECREKGTRNIQYQVRQNSESSDRLDCRKAINRLEDVFADDSIVHEIIQNAIDLGCTDVNTVFVKDLIKGRVSKNNVSSMKTEAGHSYGRYFIGEGRGDYASVSFTPKVWRKLNELGWTKSITLYK